MRVLLIGGYGGFGARIARRLHAGDHHILVAGRDLERARAVCGGQHRLEPVRFDRLMLCGFHHDVE